jgi:hypothetical protein
MRLPHHILKEDRKPCPFLFAQLIVPYPLLRQPALSLTQAFPLKRQVVGQVIPPPGNVFIMLFSRLLLF